MTPVSTPQTEVIAEPLAGPVRGLVCDGVAAFLGIPYAKPPVGDRRFRAPEPVDAWTEVRDATAPGPAAPQGPSALGALLGPDPGPQSEDCLTINVYSPRTDLARGQALPVLVWIHGGGFRAGRAGGPRQAAQRLARQGPMVVVTMNYRLAALGYLYLVEVADGFGEGNFGLLDQAAALAWVTANVAAFGGDPDQITVGGHSAGAVSAVALARVTPPGTRIRRLIMQSAGLTDLATPEQATAHAKAHLDVLGIGAGGLHRLRELPAQALVDASAGLSESHRSSPLLVVGGAGLPRAPLDPQGSPPPDLLAGTTRDEARAFLPSEPGGRPVSARAAALTRSFFEDPLDRHCELVTRDGRTVYRYRFDWCAPGQWDRFGACHGVDVPFLLGSQEVWADAPALAGADAAQVDALGTAFRSAFARFVVSGHPADDWQPWTTATRTTHAFTTAEAADAASDVPTTTTAQSCTHR